MKNLDGLVRKIFKIGFLPAKILTATLIGAHYHEELIRAEQFVLFHNQKPQPGYFQDPLGVSLEIRINSHGNEEIYLVHERSKTEISIGEDLCPKDPYLLLDAFRRRLESGKYNNGDLAGKAVKLGAEYLR